VLPSRRKEKYCRSKGLATNALAHVSWQLQDVGDRRIRTLQQCVETQLFTAKSIPDWFLSKPGRLVVLIWLGYGPGACLTN